VSGFLLAQVGYVPSGYVQIKHTIITTQNKNKINIKLKLKEINKRTKKILT
jgi:hypothetical protein